MNKVFAPIPAFHLRPTLLTTSILIALGLGFGTPTLAKSKQANTLQCLGIQTNKFLGNQGTNLCPSPSATAVSSNQSKPIAFGGNPINLLTGNKFEQILDIDDVGDVFVLRLTRYYNSQSTQKGIFGIGWRSDYEMQLQDLGTGIQILGTDGTHYHFDKIEHKDNKTGLLSERFVSNDISLGYVIIKPTNSNGIHSGNTLWQWHLPDGRVFEFSPHKQVSKINSESRYQYGQLSRVQKLSLGKNAPYWQLRYNKDGKLIQVSNHLGQTLRFDYQTQNDGLSYITVTKEQAKSNNTGNNTSNKQVWQYHIDKAGNLSEVITHQGDKLGYEYTDPHDKHNLTAKYRYINHQNHHLNDTQKSSKHKNSDASNNQRNDKDKITNNKILISRFAYDAYDRAILSTGDNDAGKITISYDDKVGYPILGDTYTNTLTNSLGQTTQYHYTYDKTGVRLLSAVGTGCMTCNLSNVRYEYNKQGWVVAELTLDSVTHHVIHTKRYVYDAFGRVIQTAIQDKQDKGSLNTTKNSTTNITYTYVSDNQDDSAFYLVKSMTTDSVFDNKRSGIEYTYDDSGNVVKVREFGYDGDGNVLERHLYYTYNLQGLLDTVEIDANNNIGTNHGSTENVTNRNHTKTKLISFVYNKHNQLIQSSEQGLDTKYDYDNQGNLSLVIHPDGQTTHYTYNVYNKPIHIKTGKQFITIDYDDRQRPIYYTDHLGQDIYINYDDVKHSIHYTLANGQAVSDVYNTEHEFIKRNIKDSQGGVILTDTNHHHDNLDTKNTILELSTSPITSLIINKALSKLTLATGANYIRHYDDFGRIRLAVDANTGKRHIQYDIMDRPTHINLDGTNQQINYNALGLPSTFTACTTSNNHVTQDCQTTTYHYDTYGKLTKVQHQQTQNGKTQDIQTPSIQYQYTNTGLIESEVTTLTPNQDYRTQYHYDDKDRIQRVILPEGISLHYHYNKHSQVTQIDYQTPTSTLWQTLASQWHQLFGKNNGNTLLSNIKADSTRGLLELQHANGSTVSQIYNNHAKLTDKHDHSITTKVDYDNKTGQITSIEANGNLKTIDEITNAYKYDSNGNRISHTTSNNPSIINQQSKTNPKTHYTYEPNSDRLSVITIKDDKDNIIKTTHYTYDNLGNPVMITTKDHKGNIISQRALDYTPDGQIKSIKDNDKLIATYQYNHLRQRVSKVVYDDKGAIKDITQYLWDKGLLSAEIKGNPTTNKPQITRRYIYLDIMPVAVLDYGYDSKGKLNETKVYSVHTDHLGTPKAITNQNKEVVWQIDMDTFGETKQIQAKTITDPNTNTQKPFTFNLRFAGQYFDSETGYHYNYHRYYDPSLGRYLTSDPIGLWGGLNTYGYVDGRPYEFVDPDGLKYIRKTSDHLEPFIRKYTCGQGNLRVDIGYTPAAGHGVHQKFHAFALITDIFTERQYILRAGPSVGAGHGWGSQGAFGYLFAETGRWNSNSRDKLQDTVAIQHVGFLNNSVNEITNWSREYAQAVNIQKNTYEATKRNSNSVAFSFIESLGFNKPLPILSAPAWQNSPFKTSVRLSYSGKVKVTEYVSNSQDAPIIIPALIPMMGNVKIVGDNIK